MANAIAGILSNYDAIFALGGKSLITILYTEGSAVPEGCDTYQLSANVRDLGRTYATKLAVAGDIRATLQELLPHINAAAQGRESAYAALVQNAANKRAAQRGARSDGARADGRAQKSRLWSPHTRPFGGSDQKSPSSTRLSRHRAMSASS